MLNNLIAVYQYTGKGTYDKNNYIVITPIKINGVNLIVPVEINKRGQYKLAEIKYNRIKSVYPKNDIYYISRLLAQGKIKEIFTQSDSEQTSLSANNVPQSNSRVNTSTSNK